MENVKISINKRKKLYHAFALVHAVLHCILSWIGVVATAS